VQALLADKRERECAEYTADCTGAILRRFYRFCGVEDFEFPLFTELYAEEKEPEPEVTVKDVSERLLSLLDPPG